MPNCLATRGVIVPVWDVFWLVIMSFALLAYLILLFTIIGDLFQDPHTSGIAKAAWVIFLFILPLITSLVYLITRGSDMAERRAAEADFVRGRREARAERDGGSGAAAEIAEAKKLLDAGTISAEEFERLKSKALA
ncbi:SHOCT domain-containing protein [Nocardia sp. KC 131]|uniref:SHOCT domain-containing protein n=1 Tax=Nocardia arseniciresistens TaxID=3392119 RepID=UPI00398F0999